MKKFHLVSDSASDLPLDVLKEQDVKLFPLHFYFGEEEFEDDKTEKQITNKDFYARMRAGEVSTTSAISLGMIEDYFEEMAQKGEDVLYIAFSSGLSNSYNTGVVAMNAVKERHPDAKIYVVDSLAASLGQGLLVYLCALKTNAGASIEEVRDYAEATKLHVCHFFTVDDLQFLKRGGRINAATALVGGLLNIKPMLHTDDEGHLVSIGKARGRKASIAGLAASLEGNELPETKEIAFICQGDCIEDAELLKSILINDHGFKKVLIGYTGPVIASHSGPGTLALFYVGGKR